MSVHLGGGGGATSAVYRPFLVEAMARAAASGRSAPKIAIIVVRDGDGEEHAGALVDALVAAAADEAGAASESSEAIDPLITILGEGDLAALPAVADVDGIVIGGGLTPAYLTAILPIAGEIRRAVAAGVPYLGFSAGAMIVAERAIIGGHRIGGVPVSPEDGAEGLGEVSIVPGIGLLDVTIEVHAAQWGNLSRLIAATEAGLTDGGLAIDEGTVLIVGEGALSVVGVGSVWRVSEAPEGVLVNTIGA